MLAHALFTQGDRHQAATTFHAALECAVSMPMPLRAADILDGLAMVAEDQEPREARVLSAAATEIRSTRQAMPWGITARTRTTPARSAPAGWVEDGHLTAAGLAEVTRMFAGGVQTSGGGASPLDQLTRAEREVAERVADGLTSRQVAEELFVSPRTVDTHLAHIYRKLEINTRARLAAMVVDLRR